MSIDLLMNRANPKALDLTEAVKSKAWNWDDFYPAARQCVVDRGIVRRRKVDVAADIPARRIADLPVELDEKVGRSIREAERSLARRMVAQYESALARRRSGPVVEGIDLVFWVTVAICISSSASIRAMGS